MDKKEFMRLTGKSVTQTRKLCDKGKFLVDGFGWFEAVRGKGKTSKVDIRALKEENAASLENRLEKMAQLKARKLEAEIANLNQRLHERQEKIEKEYEAVVIDRLSEILKPLEKAFKACSLTQEQTNLINAALDESLRRLNA